MGVAGDEPPAELAERIADVMFALSSPNRVRLLLCLLEGPRSVGALTDALGLEQSAVSHQLRVLREHGLVSAERQGRRRLYTLAGEDVAALVRDAMAAVDDPRPARRTARERGA